MTGSIALLAGAAIIPASLSGQAFSQGRTADDPPDEGDLGMYATSDIYIIECKLLAVGIGS